MKRNWILFLAAAAALLAGCEKEIEMDYRPIGKLFVIEGKLNNEDIQVAVSQTRDMTDSVPGKCIEGATVQLRGDNGTSTPLVLRDGRYRPVDSAFVGVDGVSYVLDVAVEGNHFSSTSTKHAQVAVDTMSFSWQRLVGKKMMLMCSIAIQDIPDQENYYRYTVHINDMRFRWHVLRDKGNDGRLIPVNFRLADEEGELRGDEFKDMFIRDGDLITIEVQSIDRGVYDYFYSLGLGDRASTNPISNFTGDCLGYFSAYSFTPLQERFYFKNVKESE